MTERELRAEQRLKSVDEHNAERRATREEAEKRLRLTGVPCPKCGRELEWTAGSYVTIGFAYPPPTTSKATCPTCGLSIDLEK